MLIIAEELEEVKFLNAYLKMDTLLADWTLDIFSSDIIDLKYNIVIDRCIYIYYLLLCIVCRYELRNKLPINGRLMTNLTIAYHPGLSYFSKFL